VFFDEVVASFSIRIATIQGTPHPIPSIHSVAGINSTGLGSFGVFTHYGPSSVMSGLAFGLSVPLLRGCTAPTPLDISTENSCRSSQERPPRMYVVFWVEVDTHLVLAKRSVRIYRV